MRADAIRPRTWLLATVAAWAVLVALLTLLGLGGRIKPLPDDPASVPRLPALPRVNAERIGPLAQYSQLTTRPPFYESRRPQPFYISGQSDAQPATFDYLLTSVLITPAFRMAILQPSAGGEGIRVRVGEASSALPQWTLIELAPRSAVFEGPDGRRTLELRVFDGNGGQPPTASRAGGAPNAPPVSAPMPAPTGGNAPAQPMSAPPAANPAPTEAPESPAMTTEQQMDAIRKRIEARRAQIRQQQQQQGGQNPPPASPPR